MLSGGTVQEDGRLAIVRTHDFDVGPDHAFRPQTGAESLRRGFFGRKASRVMDRWIGAGITVGDLARGEGALLEAIGMPREQLADAGHLDEVDAGASDHFAG